MFYTYVFLLCLFIVGVSYYNTLLGSDLLQEPFVPGNEKTYILLGDSILKNNNYAKHGKGIDDLLIERNEGNVTSLALDNSTIVDVYKQISSIPIDKNTPDTLIFLSVGGNNILQNYVEQSNNDLNDITYLKTIFAAYKTLVRTLREKMTQSQLVLVDIYYPENVKYQVYRDLITKWNTMLYEYARENGINILKISKVITDKGDFTLGYEPSDQGGAKIVDLIANYRYVER